MHKLKRLVILDTETTGLPKDRWVSALQAPNNWPDLVSVAWSVFENGEKQHSRYSLIIPESWDIPAESTKIHGITWDIATAKGSLLTDILWELAEDLKASDAVVAHNLEFDRNVLFNAYEWRMNWNPHNFWPTTEFCTMKAAEPELKLPLSYESAKKKYKSPNLGELYKATFGEPPPDGAHNSQRDVEVLSEIFWKRWGST